MLPPAINTLVKLNIDRCFTSASGGLRMKPLASATLDREGLIPVRLRQKPSLGISLAKVMMKINQPYLLVDVYVDRYEIKKVAVVLDFQTGNELDVEYSWLEEY